MNYDLALIAAVLETRSLKEALAEGVRLEHLTGDAQIYWDILLQHYEQHNEVPSIPFFCGICPQYEHSDPLDSIPAIVHELKTRHLYQEIGGAVQAIGEANEDDPWKAKSLLAEVADRINTQNQKGNTDLIAGSDREEVFKTIKHLQDGGGLLGLPWPWDYMNENSVGIVEDHLIYVYGREKSKKTFLLLYMALWFEFLGLRTLFFTRDMGRKEIAWRLYAMRAQILYGHMVKGDISSDGMHTLEEALRDLERNRNIIITESEGGIVGVRAKVEEYRPHVIIHDYMRAIADDAMEGIRNPKEERYIAKGADELKKMAMRLKIPVIACGHANREGEKLRGKSSVEYAGSDHIVRRVDYGFRIIHDDVNDRIALILNAGRSTRKFLTFTVNGHLGPGFGEFISPDAPWVDGVDAVQEAEAGAKEKKVDIPKNVSDKTFKQRFRR